MTRRYNSFKMKLPIEFGQIFSDPIKVGWSFFRREDHCKVHSSWTRVNRQYSLKFDEKPTKLCSNLG